MKIMTFATGLMMLPLAAWAQSGPLERLEAVYETLNESMVLVMVNEMEAEGVDPAPIMEVLPDLSWDDAMRDAGRCMLDRYDALIGRDGIDTMLTDLEAYAADLKDAGNEGLTARELADPENMLPEGVSQDQSMEITQACGMIELQMQRMSESGFTEAMMKAAQ
jgi:hypothetical protein